jgi:hypothetical protein
VAEQALAEKAQELERTKKILRNLFPLDDLTGLCNRKGLLALVEHCAKPAIAGAEPA